ncbi:hypothetical protein CEXT_768641 [Caerostris extrusa]|uniref:Uncharacterized protein n=1 Tax=Caerostris extrusa TaxID=172846 RepID=A0AAV4RSU5_CAEEX|nr:hypothetical protein CEXT_768641 [Caerostris extrusa]
MHFAKVEEKKGPVHHYRPHSFRMGANEKSFFCLTPTRNGSISSSNYPRGPPSNLLTLIQALNLKCHLRLAGPEFARPSAY